MSVRVVTKTLLHTESEHVISTIRTDDQNQLILLAYMWYHLFVSMNARDIIYSNTKWYHQFNSIRRDSLLREMVWEGGGGERENFGGSEGDGGR